MTKDEHTQSLFAGMCVLENDVCLTVDVDVDAVGTLVSICYTAPDNRAPLGRRGLYQASLRIIDNPDEPGVVELRPDRDLGGPIIVLPSTVKGVGVLWPAARALEFVGELEGDLWAVAHYRRRFWRRGFLGVDCTVRGMELLGLVDGNVGEAGAVAGETPGDRVSDEVVGRLPECTDR